MGRKSVNNALNIMEEDWKSLPIEELEEKAFYAIRNYTNIVQKKLSKILGKDKAFEIICRLWEAFNLKPMDFVKRADPEQIAAALADCNAKEVATAIRFIDNAKREKVLELMSGENGYDWREAEKHIEKNIVNLNKNEVNKEGNVEIIDERKNILTSLALHNYVLSGTLENYDRVIKNIKWSEIDYKEKYTPEEQETLINTYYFYGGALEVIRHGSEMLKNDIIKFQEHISKSDDILKFNKIEEEAEDGTKST
jgi:hypothetical protein